MVTWSCLGFPFALVPTLTFLAWSSTAGSHSKTMCVVLSLVSLKELVFLGWWSLSLWIHLCCFVATMYLFSQSLSIRSAVWGLHAIFNFLTAKCIRWPSVALIRVSCRCVIDVMLRHSVCCTALLQTWIIVCSELPSASVRVLNNRTTVAAHPL